MKRDLQPVGVDHAPVVAQRLEARRLVVRRHQRQAADLEQLRRGEEHHVRREIEDRVDEHALLDDDVVEAVLFGGDGGGEAGRTGADDQNVTNGHGVSMQLIIGRRACRALSTQNLSRNLEPEKSEQ